MDLIDVFKTNPDTFSLTSMTKAIVDLPYVPTKIGRMGLFTSEGIDTTSVVIERTAEKLTLVPTAPRGAPGQRKNVERRNVRSLQTVSMPQNFAVMADEVQNLRAFGTTSEAETLLSRFAKKMAIVRRDFDLTHEWQRMGAIKGQVLDADGTTVLLDLFAEFGLTQQTLPMTLSNNATKVLQKLVSLARMTEDAVGGVAMSGIRVEASPEFMDAFTGHPAVIDAWKYYKSQANQSDYRKGDNGNGGFEFGDIVISEYRGNVGGQRFIAAGEAFAIPLGVPDMFVSNFAPAPYTDTVNTIGLPFYASPEELPHKKGIEVECSSHPLHLNTRPNAVVKLSM